MRYFRKRKGQSLLEYALILAAIVVAIVFMQTYVRRGLQGRLKGAADDIGEQFGFGGNYNYMINRVSETNETTTNANIVTRYSDVTNRTGYQILNAKAEPWRMQ